MPSPSSAASHAPWDARYSPAVALIVAAAQVMRILDGAIINTSLPEMACSFGVAPLDLSLAVSASLTQLIVARIVQGLGGALLTPVGIAVVMRNAAKSDVAVVQFIAKELYPEQFADVDPLKTYMAYYQKYLPVRPEGTFLVTWKKP